MICFLEFGVAGGGGGGTAALKEDPKGFIQKCKRKFRISRAVAENGIRRAYPGSRIMESFFAS